MEKVTKSSLGATAEPNVDERRRLDALWLDEQNLNRCLPSSRWIGMERRMRSREVSTNPRTEPARLEQVRLGRS